MKTGARATAVIGMIVVSAFVYGLSRNTRLNGTFSSVRVGATQNEVIQAMGRPSWIEPCGKSFGEPKPHCTEFIYRNSFAPFVPEYWSVSFDTGGSVVGTYVYESP